MRSCSASSADHHLPGWGIDFMLGSGSLRRQTWLTWAGSLLHIKTKIMRRAALCFYLNLSINAHSPFDEDLIRPLFKLFGDTCKSVGQLRDAQFAHILDQEVNSGILFWHSELLF